MEEQTIKITFVGALLIAAVIIGAVLLIHRLNTRNNPRSEQSPA
jgi:hypothetical protein